MASRCAASTDGIRTPRGVPATLMDGEQKPATGAGHGAQCAVKPAPVKGRGRRPPTVATRIARAALPVLLLLLAPARPLAGQVPDARSPVRDSHLGQWLAAVQRHRPPGLGADAVAIASWPEKHLAAIVQALQELSAFLRRAHVQLARTGRSSTFTYDRRPLSATDVQQLLGLSVDEARRGDLSRVVGRGALLHTDIAVAFDALRSPMPSAAPSATATAILVLDGRQQGVVDRGPHWRLARSLLDLLAADSPRLSARRQWYVATAAHMRSRSLLADLVPHLTKARDLYPRDAEILFYSAAMNETMAAPLIQEAVRRIVLPPRVTLDVTDGRTHLEEARSLFRRALESDPGHVEARVRYGRVLGVLGRHEEAAGELERAREESASAPLRYYAALFLGRAQAALGRREAARASFARAVALYPRAQSARLALSSLAHLEGNQAQAAGVLLEALASPQDDPSRDPWWTYFAAERDASDRLLDAWRRIVARWNVE